MPPGALGAWPFCGNANDIIATNHGAVVGAALTADRFGNANSAYYFNGQPNCYINLGTSSTLKPLKGSISVWARPDGFSALGSGYLLNPIILTKNQPGNNCYEGYAIGLVTVTGYPEFHNTITQPFCNQINAIYSGVNYQSWYHIVMTWDFSTLKLYINGALHQSLNKGFPNSFLAGDSIMVGNSANVQNNRFFLGAIDDLMIYGHALQPSEVSTLYTTDLCALSSVSGQDALPALQLFPNPATEGKLFLQGLPAAQGMIDIFDARGQLLLRKNAEGEIDVSTLAAGMYVLRYSDERSSVSRKFIVQ